MESIKNKIKTFPDWPKKGIMFRDIMSLIKDPEGLKEVIDIFYNRYKDKKIDKVIGIESRGFILGAPLAYLLGVGFIPIRKPGKLPGETYSEEYTLEYGTDKIEIQKDALTTEDNVIIIDDLIATGGTMTAAINLVKKIGANIHECGFVIDLPDIKGKEKIINALGEDKTFTMVEFEGD